METIRLFDIDGVLIEDNAYSICIVDTVNHLLGENDIDIKGIISRLNTKMYDVWDQTCIISAFALERKLDLIDDLLENGKNLDKSPFPSAIDILNPSEEVAKEYLSNHKKIKNKAVSLFQQRLLGEKMFKKVYGEGIDIEILRDLPLLKEKDVPLISKESVNRLARKGSLVCVYTARPGLPPDGENEFGYSPEAEIAKDMVGMPQYPLVSFGSMEWLQAKRKVKNICDLVKPESPQLMAAIFAAFGNEIKKSLIYSYSVCNKKGDVPLNIPSNITVYIFEDSPGGLKPIDKISKILSVRSIDAKFIPIGIVAKGEESDKYRSLKEICGKNLFRDVNAALDYTFKDDSNN